MTRRYELTVIASAKLSSSDLTKLDKTLETLITKVGGKVIKKEDWGARELAYAIRKDAQGAYRYLVVELPADAPMKLERELKLMPNVLRHLLVGIK